MSDSRWAALKGHGFSRAVISREYPRASAPEGCFSQLCILLVVLLATTALHAQAWLDCRFVPGYEQSGPKRDYTPDNLFDYRDGAAEGYLIFSFARMQGIDCKSGSTIISIDVSDMTDADSAYGMFAAAVGLDDFDEVFTLGEEKTLGEDLCGHADFGDGLLGIAVGTDSNQTATLQAFAARIEPLLEGRTTPPEVLAWFPPENQQSVRLVPESVLGLKILKRGYVAKYAQGQAFIVVEQSPQSAVDVMAKLRARFEGATTIQLAEEAFQANAPYLEGLCIFRKGRIIAGYTNLPGSKAATYQAAKLLERIP